MRFAPAKGGIVDAAAGAVSIDLSGSEDSDERAGGAVSAAAAGAPVTASPGEEMTCVWLISTRAEIGELYALERDGLASETTTTEPAVAPIAAAITATRKLRLKPGMGAK